MREVEPGFILPTEKTINFAGQVSHFRNLDPLTSEALTKFAIINYRIRDIATDFRGTTNKHMGYVTSINEEGESVAVVVYREAYSDFIRNLSTIAFNVYNTYLNSNENTRAAAKDVLTFVSDFFPKNP
ncbi:MAG: hypothetical protein M1405_00460 [Patescibacteria group bacterium]|nr:hypothetical protein [Patescibacteria group bacterium]